MKLRYLKPLALVLPFFLTACPDNDYGSAPISAASGAITSQVGSDAFHGIAVPPDPGTLGNATVAGIDTNGNGIRDEVDRALAQTYGADVKIHLAAQSVAKASQAVLTTDANDPVAATAVLKSSGDAVVCMINGLGLDSSAKASEIIDRVLLLTINTPERRQQKQNISHAVGQITFRVRGVTCP